ncbi:MAG: Delta-aminolevulinic acid dehydratase [Planctomycetes bacterium]|nr:Delta-aminolevulinic acid dehydratase [Planctomycetota bacterium]
MRRLVRETDVLPRHLIQPLFVEPGTGVRRPIPAMTGQERISPDVAAEEASRCRDLGIPCVLLFGVPATKDPAGSGAWDERGPVHAAVREIKKAAPDILVAADLCLCEYTSHGHCGVLDHGSVRNDATLEVYERVAESYARCGVDVVAPSGMMDGGVASIRRALDEASAHEVAVMAYAVKYASAFYGPFREAAGSTPQEGDRKAYQMDPGNAREGLREARLDDSEGADILMVKPAGPCLDVIAKVRAATEKPLAAYQVSGEYAMIRTAGAAGLIDERAAMWESVRGIRRAGADIVITYFARELAKEHRSKGTH